MPKKNNSDRIMDLEAWRVEFEKNFIQFRDIFESRAIAHKKNNQIQIEFATEINRLHATIAEQGKLLGQHGVTMERHEKLFEKLSYHFKIA